MADFTIDATTFGSYYRYVGANGTDDTVTVNIGTGFSGSITVDSQFYDGEIETTIVNVPAGWELRLEDIQEDSSYETPSYKSLSYQVFNTEGDPVGTLSIRTNDTQGVPCFCSGSMILTPEGMVPIETLRQGDLVVTKDHGSQSIRWIGSRVLDSVTLGHQPNLRPIRIKKSSLGENMPAEDLVVSPQHRILVRSKIAGNMFGSAEVMVAAKLLLELDGIEIAHDLTEVSYHHILLDAHEVIFANGAETESLYLGEQALRALAPAAREEIHAIFPELNMSANKPAAARPFPAPRQSRKLVERHMKHCRDLVM